MLVSLQQHELIDLPVMILSEDGDPSKLDWITNRPNTVLLAWHDQSEAGPTLETLVSNIQIPESVSEQKSAVQEIHILLVDDSPTIRHNFRSLLVSEGYKVSVAASVTEAHKLALDQQFDIAIIDYYMPGENGDILIKKFKTDSRTEHIEIAVLTGGYSDQVIRGCLDAGATECMFKNEADELFLARINSIVRSVMARRSIGKERKQLEQILASVGDGVFGVDQEGKVTFLNNTASMLLGYENKRTVVGKPALNQIHHSDNKLQPLNESSCPLHKSYLFGTEIENLQTLFWRKDGTHFPVECSTRPLRYNDQHAGAVIAFRDISSRLSHEQELRWQANHDSLTKLMNRESFEIALETELAKVKNDGIKSALMFIDVDHFKYINDNAGHLAGDKILVEVGERLKSQMGENDFIARISGDEFAILLSDIDTDHSQLLKSTDRFREVIECQKFYFAETSYATTITAGVTIVDSLIKDTSDAMSQADISCNAAKNKGRNRIHIYKPEDQKPVSDTQDHLGWSTRLHDALVWNRFELHFQPIVSLSDVPVESDKSQESNNWSLWHDVPPQRYEALLRLRDKKNELISPGTFLPLAERFGIIGKIDRWVIENAFKKLAESQNLSIDLFINISVWSLIHGDLKPYILRLATKYEINLEQIIFEITESSAVRNIIEANKCIANIKETGVRFALDDFGAGFSSFYHLKNMDVDIIKIDGIFTRALSEDSVDRSVMLSINEVAHSLGKQTILEHVDRQEVIKALQGSSVDYLQGFYISEPLEKLPVAVSNPVKSAEN